MKKIFMIGLFLIIMLALGVSAGDLTLSTLSQVTAKPTRGFSTSFTATNAPNGTAVLNLDVTFSTTELNGFNVSFSPSSFNLANGTSQTVKITGLVPEDVNTRLSPFSGTVTVSGSGESESLTLNVNAESQLELDNVKFYVDGKSKSISDGDTRKDVLPGAKLEIEGDIKNTFSDDDDIEIQDVTVEITIRDLEDEGDDDAENDEDVGDIDADDEEKFSIEFEIPDDIEDGDYDVIILVEGEDENGAKHSVEWNDVKLKIEKDKHDVWITKASVSPSKIDCSRKIDVDVELKNQGTSDEDKVVLRIESPGLDIDYEDTSIPEIEEGAYDEDTEYDNSYPFEISDKVKAGTYQIEINACYDTDVCTKSKDSRKIIILTVENCEVEEEEPEEEEEEDTVVVVTPDEEEEEEEGLDIITSDVTETTETSLFESNTYFMLLIGAVGIAVIVIIIMVVILFSMKKKNL